MPKKLEVNGVIIKRTTLAKYFSRVNPAAGKTVVYYVPGAEAEVYPTTMIDGSFNFKPDQPIVMPFLSADRAKVVCQKYLDNLPVLDFEQLVLVQAEILKLTPKDQRRAEKNSAAQSFIDFYFTLYESLLKLPHPRPPQEPAHKRATFYRDLQQKLRGALVAYSDDELRAAATLYLNAAAAGEIHGARDVESGYTIHLFLTAAPGWIIKVRKQQAAQAPAPDPKNDLPFGANSSW